MVDRCEVDLSFDRSSTEPFDSLLPGSTTSLAEILSALAQVLNPFSSLVTKGVPHCCHSFRHHYVRQCFPGEGRGMSASKPTGRERNRQDVNFVVEILEKGKPPRKLWQVDNAMLAQVLARELSRRRQRAIVRRARPGEVPGAAAISMPLPRRQFKIRIGANPVLPEEELFECSSTHDMIEFIRRWFKEGEAIVPVPIQIEAKEIVVA